MTFSLLLRGGSALLAVPALAAPFSAAGQARGGAVAASSDASALQAAAGAGEVRRVYETAGWRQLWTSAASDALDLALAERDRHALDRVAFPIAGRTAAERDVARTHAALDYAGALAHGQVDPAKLHEVYTVPRPAPDLAAGLAAALGRGNVGEWLAALAPADDEYLRLSEAYRELAKSPAQPANAVAPGLLKVGSSDARIPSIERQLRADGYLSTRVTFGNGQYTPALAAAVKRLQRDYGIGDDGVIGPETIAVLNLGPDDRARAIAVALERRRWLSRTPPATRIDVNTAAAQLRYYRDGKLVDERRAIVGEPGRETPVLASPIYRLVANPTWTVPKSIQNGELANVGSDYLSAHDMVMRDGWIVQQPGPKNALGLVKFDMRNDQAIYLHDTSNRGLFDRSQRHLSHGCVRIDDALGFADAIAAQEGVSGPWEAARATGKPTFVPLPREIPVRLLYRNVFLDQAGNIVFRADPYGWNAAVAGALGFAAAAPPRARAQAVDVGP